MATVRIIAVSETYRRAPYYFAPHQDDKSKKWLTGQDINWKTGEVDGKKRYLYATDEDKKKADNAPLVIDPNESYMVKHNMTFNLDVEGDRILLNFIKTYPDIVASKKSDIVPGRHRYYVENPEDEAKETISKVNAEYNAMTEIKKMTFEEMQAFARVIGLGKVGSLSQTQIEAGLMERCKLQPAFVMSALEDPNRKVKAFLKHLIEKNILRFANGKYTYGNEILGLNELAVIDFLKNKENANMVSEFGRLLKEQPEKATA